MTLHAHINQPPRSHDVTLLILGAGWTYQFLKPRLDKPSSSVWVPPISYAATSTTGHDNTIPFKFDPESNDLEPFRKLPSAEYVLITFPLKGMGPSRKLVRMYQEIHSRWQEDERTDEGARQLTKWIQLGSTGVYNLEDWVDSRTPIDPSNERGMAENDLLSLGGCILNLAGLYGAQRQPGNWIDRVAKTKEQLASKGALHLIHGVDVARAIIAVIETDRARQDEVALCQATTTIGEKTGITSCDCDDGRCTRQHANALFGNRWIICDCVSYDWWQIVWDFRGESEEGESNAGQYQSEPKSNTYRHWVLELMQAHNVRALPRSVESLGRKLDGRKFWARVGLTPERTLRR